MSAPLAVCLLHHISPGGTAYKQAEAFTPQRRSPGKATIGQTVANSMKSVFGSGILAMPYAFALTGMSTSLQLCVILAVWSFYTTSLIARCAENVPSALTYDDVAEAALGRMGRWVGAVNLVLHQVLVCVAYFEFIATNLMSVAGMEGPYPGWLVWTLWPAFALFSCLRDMSSLSTVSVLGNFFLMLSIIVILMYALPDMHMAAWVAPPEWRISSTCSFFGIAAFTFAGHTEAVPIYLNMASPEHYHGIVVAMGILSYVLVCAVAAIAYSAYGDSTSAIIFQNMDGPCADFAKLCMCFVIYFTLPLKLFPAVQVIEGTIVGRLEDELVSEIIPMPGSFGKFVTDKKRIGLRLLLASVPVLIASVLSDFGFVVEFVGAFCLGLIGFALPPVMYLCLHRTPDTTNRLSPLNITLHLGLAVLGAGATAYTTQQVVCKNFAGICAQISFQ